MSDRRLNLISYYGISSVSQHLLGSDALTK
jgi:hypothetical protein